MSNKKLINSTKIFISTQPFGQINSKPIDILNKQNLKFIINPFNRKCTEKELRKYLKDTEILIAGTDRISKSTLDLSPNLKLIARVGVGLDGIDLNYAKKKGIKISYTPLAPVSAVSELTIANMLSLIRNIHIANFEMHKKKWQRYFGYDIKNISIGIIGVGKIGTLVIKKLLALGAKNIMINDIKKDIEIDKKYKKKVLRTSKQEIYKKCKLISLHLPLYKKTFNMISHSQLKKMSKDTMLINTSRGGIINEEDLFYALKNNIISSAALDVFENEPYKGKFSNLDNCLLTSHMGSMTHTCRSNMEIEATKEVIRFINKKPLKQSIPKYAYEKLI